MELKEFIATTLTEIVDGVTIAQESTKDSGAAISPWVRSTKGSEILKDDSGRYVTPVEFHIALTESKGKKGKMGIGVSFSQIGIGANKETDAHEASVNSVKFIVPVALPTLDRASTANRISVPESSPQPG